MKKKEYLLTIINPLLGSWPLAESLKILLENNRLNEKAIDVLIHIFQDAVHHISGEVEEEKLTKGLEKVQEIYQEESQQNKKDQIAVSRLDNLIRYL